MRNKERSGDGGMRVISIHILALGGNNDEPPKASPVVLCVYIFLSSLYRWGVVQSGNNCFVIGWSPGLVMSILKARKVK